MNLRFPSLARAAFRLSALAALLVPATVRAQEAAPKQPSTQTPAKTATKTLPVFTNGQAQVVEGFNDAKLWIHQELWVETEFDSDGDGKKDRMHVDVTRPQQTETEGLKVPVVYETSPYFSGTAMMDLKRFDWDPKHELGAKPPAHETPPPIPFMAQHSVISPTEIRTWVPRGFAVVHSESPGTGLSQGCPTVGGTNEALAPKAVIDWLNGRAHGFTTIDGTKEVKASWCTGKVGMTGTSYNGTLPIAAATTGVDGLAAIIPISPNTSYYLYYRANGLVRHPGGYMGEDMDVLYDFINSGNPERRDYCDKTVRDIELMMHIDRITGDFSDWWAARDYGNQLGKWKAATLMAHGFNDWNVMPEHSVRIYAALKQKGVPCMAYFHQGVHGGPPPLAMRNRWFTHFLCGIDNGVDKDPRAWIVREDDKPSEPTPYADYPNPEAKPVALHPLAGGAEIGGLGTAATKDQKPEKLVDDVALAGASLAAAEASPHRLLFATPELKLPLHVSGTPRLEIRLAASKPAANLSVWLVELPWTPQAKGLNTNLITRGWADPQNHDSLQKGEPLVPGTFYTLKFDLEPDDQIVPAGKRIGLMIFSSDRDFTLWPAPGTELTVDLDHTQLVLPLVGGTAEFEHAVGDGK